MLEGKASDASCLMTRRCALTKYQLAEYITVDTALSALVAGTEVLHKDHRLPLRLRKYFKSPATYPKLTPRNLAKDSATIQRFSHNETIMTRTKRSTRNSQTCSAPSLLDPLIQELRMDYDVPSIDDDWIDSRFYYGPKAPERLEAVTEIYWRLRKQNLVWGCFQSLVSHSYIDLSGLSDYISLQNFHAKDQDQVRRLTIAFEAFELLNEMANPTKKQRDCGIGIWYYAPLQWLATVILRGTQVDDLDLIYDHLSRHVHLGKVGKDAWRRWIPEGTRIWSMPDCGKPDNLAATPQERRGTQGSIGFILPMGLGSLVHDQDEVYRVFEKKYQDLAKHVKLILPNAYL